MDELYDNEDEWMICPQCKEQIHDESVQCPLCGHFILENERDHQSSFGIPKPLMVIVAIVIIILLIIAVIFQ